MKKTCKRNALLQSTRTTCRSEIRPESVFARTAINKIGLADSLSVSPEMLVNYSRQLVTNRLL